MLQRIVSKTLTESARKVGGSERIFYKMIVLHFRHIILKEKNEQAVEGEIWHASEYNLRSQVVECAEIRSMERYAICIHKMKL